MVYAPHYCSARSVDLGGSLHCLTCADTARSPPHAIHTVPADAHHCTRSRYVLDTRYHYRHLPLPPRHTITLRLPLPRTYAIFLEYRCRFHRCYGDATCGLPHTGTLDYTALPAGDTRCHRSRVYHLPYAEQQNHHCSSARSPAHTSGSQVISGFCIPHILGLSLICHLFPAHDFPVISLPATGR